MKPATLAEILVKTGLVDRDAVHDPEWFDSHDTVGRIAEAARLIEAEQSTERDAWRACASRLNESLHIAVGETGEGWETSEGENVGPVIDAAFASFNRLSEHAPAAPTRPAAASEASNPVTAAENSCHAPREGAR